MRHLALLTLAFLACAPSRARANPLDPFGLGARSAAMAGAVAADVGDYSAGYYNPAGLARPEGVRIDLSYFAAIPELQINGRDNDVEPIRGLSVGLTVPGRVGDVRFAFGVTAHLPDLRLSRTRSLPASQPRWELYDNRPHRIYLAVNLAIRPVPWLLIGGGIAFQSTSRTVLDARGTLDPFQASAARSMEELEHQVNTDLLSVRYPQVGIQIEPNDEWSFGLAYRGEFQLSLALGANVNAGIVAPGDLLIPAYFQLLSLSVNAFLPQQADLGVTWKPTPDWRIGLDVTYVNWAAYRAPISDTDLILDIRVPPELQSLIRVPGNIPGTRMVPAGFSDRFVPRLGVEVRAVHQHDLDFFVRGGALYEQSPVPPQTGITNFVDGDRVALSAGVGIALRDLGDAVPGDLIFDAYFQWSGILERTTTKASLVDPVGDYRSSGHLFALGLNAGLAFR